MLKKYDESKEVKRFKGGIHYKMQGGRLNLENINLCHVGVFGVNLHTFCNHSE